MYIPTGLISQVLTESIFFLSEDFPNNNLNIPINIILYISLSLIGFY
ncbi:hypothetical protein M087_4210 [Bacteroides fragilis str. S23 R14]|nr:hypothetical protein M087_4210 [Bacteroides fragilis str. S23 R14]EYE41557.1 hypothetical protein M138_4445 [Bacteroides fragilis str. S23L17]